MRVVAKSGDIVPGHGDTIPHRVPFCPTNEERRNGGRMAKLRVLKLAVCAMLLLAAANVAVAQTWTNGPVTGFGYTRFDGEHSRYRQGLFPGRTAKRRFHERRGVELRPDYRHLCRDWSDDAHPDFQLRHLYAAGRLQSAGWRYLGLTSSRDASTAARIPTWSKLITRAATQCGQSALTRSRAGFPAICTARKARQSTITRRMSSVDSTQRHISPPPRPGSLTAGFVGREMDATRRPALEPVLCGGRRGRQHGLRDWRRHGGCRCSSTVCQGRLRGAERQ